MNIHRTLYSHDSKMVARVHVAENSCVFSSMNGREDQSYKLKVSSQNMIKLVSRRPGNYIKFVLLSM